MIHHARGACVWFTLTCLLLVAAMCGCMEAPTAPLTGDGGTVAAPPSGPEIMKVSADGTVTLVPMPSGLQVSQPIATPDERVFDPSRRLSVSARVNGDVGGRVVCGRFVATVPPGAFPGWGTVSMTLPDSTLMVCNLEVSPAELNGFAVPVDLDLHTSGTNADLDSLEMYWWDPDNAKWTAMSCQKTTTLEPVLVDEVLAAEPVSGLRLQLPHFSTYAAGKAGW